VETGCPPPTTFCPPGADRDGGHGYDGCRPFADEMICPSLSVMAIIFMPLLQDGTDVWRPIEVTPLQDALYRVEGSMPDDETWQFPPGSVIEIKWKKFSNGESRLVPKGPAPTVRSIIVGHYQRCLGMLIGLCPLLLISNWLPRQANESLAAVPFLLTSATIALIAAILLIWRKPANLFLKSAVWSALGFGVFFALLSLTFF